MVDFTDLLTAEQSNPTAALMQILVSDYGDYDAVAAVEGDDDKLFYYDFLRSYLPGIRILYLPCGGKRAVIGLKHLASEYDWDEEPKIFYICDKDFDDYLGMVEPGIWYTPHYSIENYLASDEFAAYVLEKYSKGNLTLYQRNTVVDEFRRLFMFMVGELRTTCALMKELRQEGSGCDFDEFSVADFFDLSRAPPELRRDRWPRLRQAWCRDAEIPLRRIAATARIFTVGNHSEWLRGKLGLQAARVAFRQALQVLPKPARERAPETNLFGAEGLRNAKQFIGDIPTLEAYVAAAIA